MHIEKTCPSCGKHVVFQRIHRSFIERVTKPKYQKLQCVNCNAQVLSHLLRDEVKLHKKSA